MGGGRSDSPAEDDSGLPVQLFQDRIGEFPVDVPVCTQWPINLGLA